MLHRPPAAARPRIDKRERRRLAQREYRRRLDAGRMAVSVEISADVIEMLIASRWLLDSESSDRSKIGLALGAMVAEAAKNKP
ncbi:hypothetical protein ACVW16_001045 [Bradyrhizobium sp. USDA 4474]